MAVSYTHLDVYKRQQYGNLIPSMAESWTVSKDGLTYTYKIRQGDVYKRQYTDDLILPHPYIAERLFVLESLQELAPHFIHPTLKQPIRNLYNALKK